MDGASLVRCKTAGDDVLHARKICTCGGGARTNDLILCTWDGPGLFGAMVRSAY